jgi:adenylosuccinate synthase
MGLNIIIGAQWGDEGKGRVVDRLSKEAAYVARFNGGDNAGHTVTVGKQTFKLHLLPSGLIQPHTIGAIGNGVVVNPATLLSEAKMLMDSGITVNPERLQISHAAHIITEGHIAIDKAMEAARSEKIGTTLRGIGPAYTDKVSRAGIRMEKMLSPEEFAEAMEAHIDEVNWKLTNQYKAETLDPKAVAAASFEHARLLAPYISDVSHILHKALKTGQQVLAEGAQGTLLDLDQGTYPFVTSSNPTSPGALTGLGVGPTWVERVVGVTKAFQTRVGEGSFPTEVSGDIAGMLRGTGDKPWDEFGTTTGRPRRVGWLDLVLLRFAARINGFTELVLTKLDVLTGIPELKMCTAYRNKGGELIQDIPLGPGSLVAFTPEYEVFRGWEENLWDVRRWEDLPLQARKYIQRIEEVSEIPVRLVSVGPERNQIVEIS